MELIKHIIFSPITALVITVLATMFAIYSHYFPRSKSRISSYHSYNNLIGKSHSTLPKQISISYNNEIVKNVSSSEFVLWNSGNTVINKNQLTTIDPLRIEVNTEIKILRYQVIVENNKTNNVSLIIDDKFPNSILIDFDFLEKNEGARIEILHTGTKKDVNEKGKLIGVKSIFSKPIKLSTRKQIDKNSFKYKAYNIISNTILISIPVLIIAFLIYSFISPESAIFTRTEVQASRGPWGARLMSVLFLIIIFIQYIQLRPPFPSSLKKPDN